MVEDPMPENPVLPEAGGASEPADLPEDGIPDSPDAADQEPTAQGLGPDRYLSREISWLSFNGRVLQEAMDPRVPLFDRLNFLAIFSSNLDEFFRVRVASLRSLVRLKKKKLRKLGLTPRRLLREIHFIVTSQQQTFGSIFRSEILPELGSNGIFLLNDRTLTPEQAGFLGRYSRSQLRPHLNPQVLENREDIPFLRQGGIYLVSELWPGPEMTLASERPSYGIVEVPAPPLPRFIVVPGSGHNVLFLEDLIRLSLPDLYPDYEVGSTFAVKLSRDADLYLEDEFEGDLVGKIRESLAKRETGIPSRFLYDLQAPYSLISFMKEQLELEDEDLVPGGRYHNLQDLFQFPKPLRIDHLVRPPSEPLGHPGLDGAPSIIDAVRDRDRILHFPYQSYGYVTRFLEEAAQDPAVHRIWITLYRVAEDSAIVQSLIKAARRGADVTAFVEVKARFDEARNLGWAEEMEEAGVRTVYSKPGIKVHAKIALLSRKEGDQDRSYAYLGTGNFNEKTAQVYADHGLLTADTRLTKDVEQVFRFLWQEIDIPACEHLLVAPFTLRTGLETLINAEANRAKTGGIAGMVLKINGLEDTGMIDLLYESSQAGVRTNLIVRGICRMRPGLPGLADNVKARSIVDRFLEHARIYRFMNGGQPLLYLSSADIMKRNLDRRVEVAFPIFDPQVREELEHSLQLQLSDNTKARVLDPDQENNYVGRRAGEPRVEAQQGFYEWLEDGLFREP